MTKPNSWTDGRKTYPLPDGCFIHDTIHAGLEIKAWQDGDGRYIEGYASTRAVDSYNDIVEPTAFVSSKDAYLNQGGTLLYGHGGFIGLADMPIGRVLPDHFTIDDNGLRIRAEIADTDRGRDVWTLVKMGALKGFSIGFRIKKQETDEEQDPPLRTIKDLRLYEISVVTVPANPETWFAAVTEKGFQPESIEFKSLLNPANGDEGEAPKAPQRKEIPMADEQLVRKLGEIETALEKVPKAAEIERLQVDLGRLSKMVDDMSAKLAAGQITPTEFTTFTAKISGDMVALQTELATAVQQVKNMAELDRRRAHTPNDTLAWRKLLPEYADRSALDLFLRAPIDYKGANGDLIRASRNLWDATILMKQIDKSARERGHDPKFTAQIDRYAKSLIGLMDHYDPLIVKSFSSTTSGYGSDWVNTIPSAELFELYDLNMTVESEFPHYTMTGASVKYPLLTAHAKAYTADNATSNNPNQYRKGDFTTSSVTLTAKKMACAVLVDEESVEGDSIVNVLPLIRQELGRALPAGVEDAIFNGDTTATHYDTERTVAADNIYTTDAWKGLRRLAYDASRTWDVQSATAGEGDGTTAFTASDVAYLRTYIGARGIRSSDVRLYSSVKGYYLMTAFNEVRQPGTYAAGAGWVTGDVAQLAGMPIKVSEFISDEMTTAGIWEPDTNHASSVIVCFDRTGFIVGDRRMMTIEFEKDIRSGSWAFVGTVRKAFAKVTPSTEYPVAVGINVPVG
ncbi:MAG: HK97 family phage prohead protease [Dehalococcoidia bacterium]